MRFLAAIVAMFILMGGIGYGLMLVTTRNEVVAEKIDILAAPDDGPLTGAIGDDIIETKVMRRLNFEQDLVYPVKSGEAEVNRSDAVIRLGLDVIDAKSEPVFAKTYKTFNEAQLAGLTLPGAEKHSVIPSASLMFHKARSLDSGVLATLDMAMCLGQNDRSVGLIQLVKDIFNALEKTDIARAYLAAALELAGHPVEVYPEEVARRNVWVTRYRTQRRDIYPPIDYYAWNKQLEQIYDFETFLQEDIPRRNWFMAAQIARALKKEENKELLNRYRAILNGFDFLYMPRRTFTVEDLVGIPVIGDETIMDMFRRRPGMQLRIVFLSPAWRREQIHFGEMLPLGVAPGLDPLTELTQRSMVGFVSFIPQSGRPGVEQFHSLALDSLISEQRSLESDKLLLTRVYRERLFHPYLAVDREIYESQRDEMIVPEPWKPTDEGKVCPTLRVEPVPQYYIRSARAYQYMNLVMGLILGEKTSKEIRRVLPDGSRHTEPMADEIARLTRLLFGMYIVTCEDLGMRPSFDTNDMIDAAQCKHEALEWIDHAFEDADAMEDARYMSPPIFVRPGDKNKVDQMVLTWCNLGVQLSKLRGTYAQTPQIKQPGENSIWTAPDPKLLGTARYILPNVHFATLELLSRGGLTTTQFREICDKGEQDQAKIQAALLAIEPPALTRAPNEEAITPQQLEESAGDRMRPKEPTPNPQPEAPGAGPRVKPPGAPK